MKRLFVMSILSTILGLFGCSAQSDKYRSVEAKEFAEVIADSNVVRLDVRTAEEFTEEHIDGAINIDVLSNDFTSKACASLPKDKTIALYCRSGRRSKKAADILSANGYTVVELNSGYIGWCKANK